MNPLEIMRRTPKNNCGECGFPTCLAFAAAVAKTGFDLRRCPHLNRDGLDLSPPVPGEKNDHDLELIHHLRGKISQLRLPDIAAALGAEFAPREAQLLFKFMGREVALNAKAVTIAGHEPDDPRDQILLYNYVHSGGAPAPTGDWIGMETLPNSISKTRTLAVYGEDRLAELFSTLALKKIQALARECGGKAENQDGASLALVIPVLPRLPQKIIYWEECPDEGFTAKVKILFDRHVLDFLDLESLVFSVERMCDRFTDLCRP